MPKVSHYGMLDNSLAYFASLQKHKQRFRKFAKIVEVHSPKACFLTAWVLLSQY